MDNLGFGGVVGLFVDEACQALAGFVGRDTGVALLLCGVGRDRFVRNCLYAAGNSGSAALAPLVEGLRGDPDPAVSEAADWAARRLG